MSYVGNCFSLDYISKMGSCNLLLDNRLYEAVFNVEEAGLCGPNAHCANSSSVNLEVPMFDGHENEGMDGMFILPKASTRRRKKLRKSVAQLVYGEENLEVNISDASLSDEDIEHRNSIIWKEVVAS